MCEEAGKHDVKICKVHFVKEQKKLVKNGRVQRTRVVNSCSDGSRGITQNDVQNFMEQKQGGHLFFKRNPQKFPLWTFFSTNFFPNSTKFLQIVNLIYPRICPFFYKSFHISPNFYNFCKLKEKSCKWHSFYDTPDGN